LRGGVLKEWSSWVVSGGNISLHHHKLVQKLVKKLQTVLQRQVVLISLKSPLLILVTTPPGQFSLRGERLSRIFLANSNSGSLYWSPGQQNNVKNKFVKDK